MVSTHRRVHAVAAVAVTMLSSAATAAPAPQEVFLFAGRGHGHGVGLAQDSANAMAAAGAGHEQILEHFYPGTTRGSRTGTVRVDVWEGAGATAVTLSLPNGGRVTGDKGSTQAAAGAVLQIAYDASGYHVRQVGGGSPGTVSARARWAAEPLASDPPSPSGLPIPLPTATRSEAPSPTPTPSPSARLSPRPGRASAPPSSSPEASPSPVPSPVAAASLDSAGPVTVTPSGSGVTQVQATGRTYRGDVIALSRDGFRLINRLDVETYLRGLGEVPSGWPGAALRAQAVAARTYALRATSGGAPLGYDLCDDARCQVYLGAQRETARSDEATSATRGEVITYSHRLAEAFYSANAGGRTASPAEGFGSTNNTPYLRSGIPAPGVVATWTQAVAPAALAARLQYPGRLTDIQVSKHGPSGRVTELMLQGSVGPRVVTGVVAAQRLGLWSTLFSVRRGSGIAQPLPPTAALTQLAPETASVAPPAASPSPSPSPAAVVAVAPATRSRRAAGAVIAIAVALLVGAVGLMAVDGVRRRHQRRHCGLAPKSKAAGQ